MKNPINKRIARQLVKNPAKYLPIILAMVFVVVFSSSFFTSQDSAKALYYEQINKGKVEDGQFTTIYPLDDVTKGKLEDENIDLYENFNVEISHTNERKLKAFINRKNINIAQILEGRLAERKDEVAISGNYARANKIKLEDSIKLNDKNFKVVGIVSLPDYSSILRNRDDLVMDTGYYGTCLLDKDGFELFKDVPIKYTYSYHTKNNLTKKPANDKLKDLIKIIMKKNVVIDAVTSYDNHCITYLMDDMDGDVPTMTTFMVILFIALAFVSAVQIKSMIEKESSVIGTLLASGYTKAELLKNYMITPVIMTLFSAVVGNVISYSYAYKKYVFLYYQSFDLPKFKPIISLRSFLITCIIPLTIYMVINLLVISMKLKATPLEFLRGTFKREKRKSKVKLTKFNIMTKFKLRMFLDNKFNLIALAFGIFLANMILLYGLSVKPIFESYSENMKNTMKYNYTYFVRTEEKNVKADKSTILDVELMDNDNKKVQFYGVDDNSNYKIKNLSQLKKDEVVVSKGFLQRFEHKINDKIKITEPYNSKTLELKIKGVDEDNNLYQIFTKRELLNKIIEKDSGYFNAYQSNSKLHISNSNLITKINRDEMDKFMIHFLDSFGVVFKMLFYIGIGFYLIITFIISNIILDKSKLNISYLKIFGYNDGEIMSIYVNIVFVMLVVFQLIMIPLIDKLFKLIILVVMSKFDAYIIAEIPVHMYLLAILYSIIIFAVIQLLQKIKISKLDMVKELKTING